MPIGDTFYQESRSFPPLFPILVGLASKITHLGIASGLIVNLIIFGLILHFFFKLAKDLSQELYWVIFLMLPIFTLYNLLNSSGFGEEISSAGSIPLSFLISILILHILTQNKVLNNSATFLLGVYIGTLYLTRFDSTFLCAALVIYISLFKIKTNQIKLLIGGSLLVTAPWIIRNLIIFGTPLTSDNSLTILSTFKSIVPISWFEHGLPLLTEEPILWLKQRIYYIIRNTKHFIGTFPSLIIILLTLFAFFYKPIPYKIRTFITLTWITVITNIIVVSLTPYGDERYFSWSSLMISTAGVLVLIFLHQNQKTTQTDKIIHTVPPMKSMSILSWILCIFVGLSLVQSKIKAGDIKNGQTYQNIYDSFKDDIPQNELVANDKAEHLAYYSTWKTIFLPINCDEINNDFRSWQNKFHVRYAIIADDSAFAESPGLSIKKRAGKWLLLDLSKINETK